MLPLLECSGRENKRKKGNNAGSQSILLDRLLDYKLESVCLLVDKISLADRVTNRREESLRCRNSL